MRPLDPERKELLRAFLARLGWTQESEDLSRYHRAFVHTSYASEQGCDSGEADNERLEFLGDRVLNLIVAEHLYTILPGPEGELTAGMEFTNNRNLASVIAASGTGFENLILTGTGQNLTDRIIAGSFEAFIAACYLDAGLEETRALVFRFLPDDPRDFCHRINYKKILQEHYQKNHLPIPIYELGSQEGADHEPKFVYLVMAGGAVLGRGAGRNKTEATQDAARDALEHLSSREEYP